MSIKARRGRCKEYSSDSSKYVEGEKPWGVEADIAIPCATQVREDEMFLRWPVHGSSLAVLSF